MKLSGLIFALSAATSVVAHPFDQPFDVSQSDAEALTKRQSGGVLTEGIRGNVYPRLEVRQMLFDRPNQWILLILGMREFMSQSPQSRTSYYQIAGIHGVPFEDYDNVGQCSQCQNAQGYCTHDSVLFPAWHRAYTALFEQEFLNVVNNIANNWPTSGSAKSRAEMQGAASFMRFPYWDWASHPANGKDNMPDIVSSKFMEVEGQNGPVNMINPLFRYDYYGTQSANVWTPWTNWPVTLRHPESTSPTASSKVGEMVNQFNSVRGNLQDQIRQLLTTCDSYGPFSNDQSNFASSSCSNSIEGIHNTIHSVGGGPNGHMTYLAEAAFDPLFWLHHFNVDRIYAMWQTIHPNTWGASQSAPGTTWTIAQGSNQNVNSPLTPFRRTQGNFWTTADVRDFTRFGYTYPEFATSDGSRGAITRYVRQLYGQGSSDNWRSIRPALPRRDLSEPTNSTGPINGTASNATYAVHNMTIPASSYVAPNGSNFEWVCNINTPRYALNGSFTIHLFIGEPETDNPLEWLSDANLVGPMGVIAQPERMHMDINIAGSIPMTTKLVQAVNNGDLASLNEDDVNAYLKDKITWKILGRDNVIIDPGSLKDFSAGVYGSTVSLPEDEDELPEYSEFHLHPMITEGKPGGLCVDGTNGSKGKPDGPVTVTRAVTATTTVCPKKCEATA